MVELQNTSKNITEHDFNDFENHIGLRLPVSFKNHYLTHNGGNPAEEDVENGRWGIPLHGFNPIKYGNLTIETLIKDIDRIDPKDSSLGSWGKLSFVPFAYDAGAHPIFLSLREEDYDHIYIYDPDGGAVKKISTSFEAFLSKLYKSNR